MTVAELFHHERLFIGCLAISRVKRFAAGSKIGEGDASHALSSEDASAWQAVLGEILFDPLTQSEYWYSIATQGFDYPSIDCCPALEADGRCGVHHNRKPSICQTVPLDPMLPDRLQHIVLHRRSAIENYIGAGCITAGMPQDFAPLVHDGKIVDQGFRAGLARRRADLATEKDIWGNLVYSLFKNELFDQPAQLRRIPDAGFLTLAMVPILAGLAEISEACRKRCLRYIDSQLALIDLHIQRALLRKQGEERQTTQMLRTFVQAYVRLQDVLQQGSTTICQRDDVRDIAAKVEAYLGITSSAALLY